MGSPGGLVGGSPGSSRRGCRREGFALVLAVLTLVGLTLLVHGGLLLARHEERVARMGAKLLQARSQAGLGLEEVRVAAPALPEAGLGAGDTLTGSGPGGSFQAIRLRVAREWWVVESVGAAPGGTPRVRLRLPVWALHVPTRVADFRGVVEVGGGAPVQGAGRIDGQTVRDPPTGRTGLACHRWDPALDSLGLDRLPPTAARSFVPGSPALGLLGPDTLAGRIPVHLEGEGTPSPSDEAGHCGPEAPWNWGDPRLEATACRHRMVARAASGDLVVRGGVGQGLLVVGGDLAFTGEADFRGMVLVGGRLVVRGGARLQGLARAGGGVEVASGSAIRGSACWAAAALEGASAYLDGPLHAPGGEPPLLLPPR